MKTGRYIAIPEYLKKRLIDRYDLAAFVALLDIEGERVKVSTADQKVLFGRAVFGKKNAIFDTTANNGQGEVMVYWSVGFGTDTTGFTLSYSDMVR